MKKYIIATLFVCAVSNSLFAQEQCPGESLTISKYEEVPASWTDCFGKIIFGSNSGERVGYKYEGEFKNGKIHGQGTFTWAGEWQGQQYIGEFKEGEMHGQGTYTYEDGEKYVGEWKEGEMHGQGTYTYEDGEKYVGEFKEGEMHGQGTYTYKNGDKYVGEWKEDKKHGQGTYTYEDGYKWRESVGEWRENRLWNGKRIKRFNSRLDTEYEYENGEYTGNTIDVLNKEEKAKEKAEVAILLEKKKRFQEKVKSANVDKNKCYTLLKHGYYALQRGDIAFASYAIRSVQPYIDKITVLNPSIDSPTQDYLLLNSPSTNDVWYRYIDSSGAYHHIWVACLNFTDSIEVANPFD